MKTKETEGFIYLAYAKRTDCLKIGFSEDPSKRLRQLQTGSPTRLYLLAQWPAPSYMEGRVHQALAEYRRGGEWFAAFTDIGKLIWEVLNGQWTPPSTLHSGQPLPFPALRHPEGRYYYEIREAKSGDMKVVCRWRESDRNAKGKRVKRNLLCGRWPRLAREGLPDDPVLAEAIVFATAEAFRQARLNLAQTRTAA